MKTTQGKAISAFITLMEMSKKPMTGQAAFKLFKLKKKLRDIVDFQTEQEQKLAEELGGTITENGKIEFTDPSLYPEFKRRHKELEDLECEIETEKISMTMKELPDMSIAEMDALDEFIDWRE